jgi:uncharacterized protein (TIGR04255 family)
MPTPNPKLNTNVLAEVLVEIRFNPVKDVSLIVGSMNTELPAYPEFENLNAPDFPDLPLPPQFGSIVKYRFYSADRKKLYQLGRGVLSMNTTDYKSYEEFKKDVKSVLTVFKKVSGVSEISRIGLRYINKISKGDKELKDLLTLSLNLPEEMVKDQKELSFQTVSKNNEDSIITRFQSSELIPDKDVILDFDYFSEKTSEFNVENLLSWLESAHTNVYNLFLTSLNKDYLESLR